MSLSIERSQTDPDIIHPSESPYMFWAIFINSRLSRPIPAIDMALTWLTATLWWMAIDSDQLIVCLVGHMLGHSTAECFKLYVLQSSAPSAGPPLNHSPTIFSHLKLQHYTAATCLNSTACLFTDMTPYTNQSILFNFKVAFYNFFLMKKYLSIYLSIYLSTIKQRPVIEVI